MHSDVIIEKVTLTNFRSHKNTNIDTPESNVVLFGENGSGKTNILEAISLFSPGRGLRGATNQDLVTVEENINSFEIKILLKYNPLVGATNESACLSSDARTSSILLGIFFPWLILTINPIILLTC